MQYSVEMPEIPQGLCQLRLRGGDVFIEGGRKAVVVAPETAAKSGLISELQLHTEDGLTFTTTTPLSLLEINSWMDIAGAHPGRPGHSLDMMSHLRLRHALTAADFLCDDESTALLTKALGKMMVSLSSSSGLPRQADCTRASQIVRRVPQGTVPSILQAALQPVPGVAADEPLPLHNPQLAHRLLLLLPASSHAHVMREFCRPPGRSAAAVAGTGTSSGETVRMVLHGTPPGSKIAWDDRLPLVHSPWHPRFRDDTMVKRAARSRSNDGRISRDRRKYRIQLSERQPDLVRLLEAAALLAGGDPDCAESVKVAADVGDDSGRQHVHAAGSDAHMASPDIGSLEVGERAAKRSRPPPQPQESPTTSPRSVGPRDAGVEQPQDGRPRALLTALTIEHSFGWLEWIPARWTQCLVRLRSLRQLAVRVPELYVLSCYNQTRSPSFTSGGAQRFVAAVQQLPCLEHLSVDIGKIIVLMRFPVETRSCQCHANVPFRNEDMHALVRGVCGLTQLSSLSLKGALCGYNMDTFSRQRRPQYDSHSDHDSQSDMEDDVPNASEEGTQVVRQLSRLTRLTALTFQWNVFGQAQCMNLVQTLACMPALREVHAELLLHSTDTGRNDRELEADWERDLAGPVEALWTCTSLTSLRSLGLHGVSLSRSSALGLAQLHRSVTEGHAGLLARLTGLRLQKARVDGAECAELLAAMPALRSLCLAQNKFGDAGLLAVAAVLPGLPGLTRLDVSGTAASGAGILGVVKALLGARGAGAGLRDLNIGHSSIASERVRELAGLVRRFPRLECCGLGDLELSADGVSTLSCALGGLTRLRYLYKGSSVEEGTLFASAEVAVSLEAALQRIQQKITIRTQPRSINYEEPQEQTLVSMTWPK